MHRSIWSMRSSSIRMARQRYSSKQRLSKQQAAADLAQQGGQAERLGRQGAETRRRDQDA